MKLDDALYLAELLVGDIQDYCERVEVAGSVRREKEEVKDLELVLVPRWHEQMDPTDLFGERSTRTNCLFEGWANCTPSRMGNVPVQWIKPGTSEVVPWHVQPDGKYWRGYVNPADSEGNACKIDIFLTTPENFGAQFVIRTGCHEFSQELMIHAQRVGYKFDGGYLWQGPRKIHTPEEEDIFRHLGLEWVEPKDRVSAAQVRNKIRAPKPPPHPRAAEAGQDWTARS